jgi:predicted MFS family arabinose efflux permease
MGALGGFAGGVIPGWLNSFLPALSTTRLEQITLFLACAIAVVALWPASALSLSKNESATSRNQLLLSPFLLRFLLVISLWGVVLGSFAPFATVFLRKQLHMSLQHIGFAFSLSQIAQVVAVLSVPLLIRRAGLLRTIILTQAATSIVFLCLSGASSAIAGALAFIMICTFQWMNGPAIYSLLMNCVPTDQRPGAAASYSFVVSATQLVAAGISGWAFSRFGYPATIRCIALIAALAAISFWIGMRAPQEQPASLSEPAIY